MWGHFFFSSFPPPSNSSPAILNWELRPFSLPKVVNWQIHSNFHLTEFDLRLCYLTKAEAICKRVVPGQPEINLWHPQIRWALEPPGFINRKDSFLRPDRQPVISKGMPGEEGEGHTLSFCNQQWDLMRDWDLFLCLWWREVNQKEEGDGDTEDTEENPG